MSFDLSQLPRVVERTGLILRECGAFIKTAHAIDSALVVKPGDVNFVTAYDVEVQRRLQAALLEILPEASFIGEESDSNEMNAPLAFIVDPIDGTTNFICGYQHSAISVGLRWEGRMVAAVVYDPYLDELFTAIEGQGAYCNGRRLQLSPAPLSDVIVGFGTTPYDHSKSHATFTLVEQCFLRSRGVRRSGSAALDLCYVAAGRTGGFFELRLQNWDFSAASLLILEAGGVITQLDGTPITLDGPCPILAGNPQTHAELMQLCASCL